MKEEILQESPLIKIVQADCLEYMKSIPDKSIDLILTDPPYGLEWKLDNVFNNKSIGVCCTERVETNKWDKIPDKEIFDLMKSKSKEQIIWGGNYFCNMLGSFKNPIIWDKLTGNNTFADGELAWTSFKTGTLRIIRHQWCGAFKDSERGIKNEHPTQKPIFLMKWCLLKYSQENDTVLDPFAGSFTTGVACAELNRNFIGIEISSRYVEIGRQRIKKQLSQLKLF